MKRTLKKHSLANGWGDWTMLREENVLHAVDAMLSVTKRRHFGSSSRHFLRGPTAHHMRWLVCSISQGHWKSGRHSSLVFKGALAKACHVTHVVKHWPFVLIIASWEKVHMITKSSSKGSQPGFNLWFICCYSGRFICILCLLQRHIFQAIVCKLYSASSLSNTYDRDSLKILFLFFIWMLLLVATCWRGWGQRWRPGCWWNVSWWLQVEDCRFIYRERLPDIIGATFLLIIC